MDRDTNYPGDMKDQLLAAMLDEMKKNAALLQSILGEVKQINRNKQDQNPPMGKGKEIDTVHKDQLPEHRPLLSGSCSRQSLPQSVSLRTEGKKSKYRLHVVGEVRNVPDEKGSIPRNVIRGIPLKVEVILKDGDQLVAADDPFASMRVKLVVLDEHCYLEGSSDWTREEFEGHFMMVSKDSKKPKKNASSKDSRTRMTVDKEVFSLVGGRRVHESASINQSSGGSKVKLGVMVYDAADSRGQERVLEGVSFANSRGQERVLEGVSSNKFYVIEPPRASTTPGLTTGTSQLNTNEESILGKRAKSNSDNPSTSNSQYSGQNAQHFGQNALHPGSGGTAPPQAFGPHYNQGLPASATMGLHSEVALDDLPMPDTTLDHVNNPLSQNLMTGCAQSVVSPILTDIEKIIELLPQMDDNQGSHSEGAPDDLPMPDTALDHVNNPLSQNLMMGTNPLHQNLQQLQSQLFKFHGRLAQGHRLEAHDIQNIIASIKLVTEDAAIINCRAREGLDLAIYLANLDEYLSSLATQLQLTSTQPTRQQPAGSYGTGGGQGQPTQLSNQVNQYLNNAILANSQGFITTPPTTGHSTNPQDLQQNTGPSRQSYPSSTSGMGGYGAGHPSSAPGMGGHGAGHPSSTPGMGGHGGFGRQQHGTMLYWRPSCAWTPNSQRTSGLSPTYLGQTNGSNRNFLDQQYSEGYTVVPGEYDNAYAAGGEQIENTYGPYGYGNEGGVLVRNSRPALMRRPPQQKVADSPLLYTPISSSSIPFGYLINDHYHGAMSMVATTHQQAMNNEGVMRKYWKIMYRRVLMMTIYEGRRLYGNNQIWWRNLIDSLAVVKRISQEQAMDEIVEMMGRLGTISKSRLTTGTRRKTGSKVVLKPEPSSSVLINTKQQEVKSQAASLDDDKNNNKSFVVVDLKATCWDRDENKYRLLRQEIVEFSSVLVDAATGHTKSTFHKYVIPTENHVLSEYCKNYNGMEQEAVERRNGAVMLSEALHLHQEWIGRLTNWNSAAAVVVTWGNWDCRTMLKQECFRKQLPIPDYFNRWINLKTPFADKYGNGYWNKSVKEALEATELLKWEGAIKGGESHARNKARLLSSLIQQGANLAITSWLDPAAAAPNN